MKSMPRQSYLFDIALGVAAGAAAVFVMGVVVTFGWLQ